MGCDNWLHPQLQQSKRNFYFFGTTTFFRELRMASIWEAVLASSVVSSTISGLIAIGSKRWTERQQRTTTSHQLARALESYARRCANEIVDTDEAARLAQKYQDDRYRCNLGLPEFQVQEIDLGRLKPEWRDRIAAFPNQIDSQKRYLNTMEEDIDDVYEWQVTKQYSKAILGKAALALAMQIRQGHKLPTEDATAACQCSLNVFASAFESKERLDKHLEECNASLNKQLFAAQSAAV